MNTSTPRVTRAMARNDSTIVLSEPSKDDLPKVKRKRLLEEIAQGKRAKPRQSITPPAPKDLELNELGVRFEKIKLSQARMVKNHGEMETKCKERLSEYDFKLSRHRELIESLQTIGAKVAETVKETVKSATAWTSDFAYLAQQPVLHSDTQKELISSIRLPVQESEDLDNTIQSIKTHIMTGAAMEEIRSICLEKLQSSLSEYTGIISEDVINHKEFSDATRIFKHQLVTQISSTQFEISTSIAESIKEMLQIWVQTGSQETAHPISNISSNIENYSLTCSKQSVALKQQISQIMQQRLDKDISMGIGRLSHHLDKQKQDLQHQANNLKQQISNRKESKSFLIAQSVQSEVDELLRDSTMQMDNQECESPKNMIQTLQENVTSYKSTMKYRGSQIQELNTELDKLSLLVASRGTVHSNALSNLTDGIPAHQWQELQAYATQVVHSTLDSLSASPSNGNKGVTVYKTGMASPTCFLEWIETQLTEIQDVCKRFPRRGNASGIGSSNEENNKNPGTNAGGVEEEPMTEPRHSQNFQTPGQTVANERTSQGIQAPCKEADTTAIPSTSGSIRQNLIAPILVQRKKRTKRRINLDKEPSQRVSPQVEKSDVEKRVDHLLAESLQNHIHYLSQERRNKIPLLLYPSTQELTSLIVLREVDDCHKLTEGSGLLGPHSRKLLTPEEVKRIGHEEPEESEEQDNTAGFISNPGPDFLETCRATAMRYGISHISWASECKKDPNLTDCIRWNRRIRALCVDTFLMGFDKDVFGKLCYQEIQKPTVTQIGKMFDTHIQYRVKLRKREEEQPGTIEKLAKEDAEQKRRKSLAAQRKATCKAPENKELHRFASLFDDDRLCSSDEASNEGYNLFVRIPMTSRHPTATGLMEYIDKLSLSQYHACKPKRPGRPPRNRLPPKPHTSKNTDSLPARGCPRDTYAESVFENRSEEDLAKLEMTSEIFSEEDRCRFGGR